MKRFLILGMAVAALVVASAPAPAQQPGSAAPQVGEEAPDFRLKATDGKEYSLKEFRGKKAVVLAWFPKALTTGCTLELNSLRDEFAMLAADKVQVFGISNDSVELNKQFSEKNQYSFPLLSDADKSYSKALGVTNPSNGFPYRWTFIIDRKGVIREIDKNVNPRTHGRDLSAKLEALGLGKK
jgi:peroxiredoxin Q/BCP